MLKVIFNKNITLYYPFLASNPSSSPEILEKIYKKSNDNEMILCSLASNPSTPLKILEELFEKDIFDINESLALNESLPLEFLNILQIDTKLRNALNKNRTFRANISQNNIKRLEIKQ
jgi:hypothetical protein